MTVIVQDENGNVIFRLPIDRADEGLMPSVEDFDRVHTALELATALVETES